MNRISEARTPDRQLLPTSIRSQFLLRSSLRYRESLKQTALLVAQLAQVCNSPLSLSPLLDTSPALANRQRQLVEKHKREL